METRPDGAQSCQENDFRVVTERVCEDSRQFRASVGDERVPLVLTTHTLLIVTEGVGEAGDDISKRCQARIDVLRFLESDTL